MEAQPNVGVVYTWSSLMNEAGAPLPGGQKPSDDEELLEKLFVMGPFIHTPTLLVRRTCFDRVGLFDTYLQIAEDWDMLLRVALAGERFAYIPKVLVRVREHTHNLTNNALRNFGYFRTVLNKARSQLPNHLQKGPIFEAAYRNLLVRTNIFFYAALSLIGEGRVFCSLTPGPQRSEQSALIALQKR